MRTVVATSAMTRLGASAYRLELAVNNRQWYSQWCQSKGRHASAPPHRRKDCVRVSHRARGGGQHGCWMWQGCHWRSLCLVCNVVAFNLGQDGVERSSKESTSTQMRRIAVLMGSGGSTSAITCLSSERCCFLAVSSWCRLSSTKAGSGNAKSADTVVCSTANANFANAAVHSADSWQCCLHALSANAFSCMVVSWQHCFLASTSSADSAACAAAS